MVFLPPRRQSPAAPRVAVDRRPDPERAARHSMQRCRTSRGTSRSALAGASAAGGLVGPGPRSQLGRRGRGRAHLGRGVGVALRTARGRPGAVAPRPVRGDPASPAATRSSATRASCTRGSSPPSACRRAPARWSSTWRRSWSQPRLTDVDGAPLVSPFPLATQDVALVVDATSPAAEVEAALRDGAGELLESLRLFDVVRRRAGGAGSPVAGLRAALPRPRPHADGRGGVGGPRRGGRRGRPPHRRRPALRLTLAAGTPSPK